MNIHKAIMNYKCGRGGLFCPCCNHYKGKNKAKLTRAVRRMVKRLEVQEGEE